VGVDAVGFASHWHKIWIYLQRQLLCNQGLPFLLELANGDRDFSGLIWLERGLD
jgi:hypothetical protein